MEGVAVGDELHLGFVVEGDGLKDVEQGEDPAELSEGDLAGLLVVDLVKRLSDNEGYFVEPPLQFGDKDLGG